MTGETHKDKGPSDTDAPTVGELDEVIEINDSINVGPFQAEILEGRVTQAPANDTHVMVVPIRCAEVESGRAQHLPPGLQVLHTYTMLTAGSK